MWRETACARRDGSILCSVNIVAALYVSAKILYDPDAREHGAGPDPGDAPYIEASVFSGTRGVKKVPPIGRWYPPPMPPAWPAGSASMSLPPGPDHTRAPGTSSATTQQSLPTSSLIPSSPSGLAGGGSDGGGMWRSTFGVHLEVRFFFRFHLHRDGGRRLFLQPCLPEMNKRLKDKILLRA